jgi:putative transposase
MTVPRQVLPGTTYLVTRRCSQRQFFLRPSRRTNETYGFVLAVAAKRFGIQVHAFCVMSNHVHLVLTDPEARLPAFSQFLDSLVARALNFMLGRRESFWAPSSYSAVALERTEDIVDKVVYVLANPVSARLVRQGSHWPGLWSAPAQIGGEALEFRRPDLFFRSRGARAMAERTSLALVAPCGFESAEEFRKAVVRGLAAKEEQEASQAEADGRPFVGAKRATAVLPTDRPAHAEPLRGLNPRVACRDQGKRVDALDRLVAFVQEYRFAFKRWREGETEVVFPAGTYLMRVVHGAACAALT